MAGSEAGMATVAASRSREGLADWQGDISSAENLLKGCSLGSDVGAAGWRWSHLPHSTRGHAQLHPGQRRPARSGEGKNEWHL